MIQLQLRQLGRNRLNMMPATILPLTVGTLAIATTIPASAQSVIVVEGSGGYNPGVVVRQSPNNVAPYIYGSPIPTPVPVNPYTGLRPSHSDSTNYDSYPTRRLEDSTLVNPVLVNPRIKDSTLINPVIVDDSRYRVPVYRPYGSQRIRVIGGY